MDFIDLKTPLTLHRAAFDTRIDSVLEHGRFINGPEVTELEDKLAAFCGSGYCIGVSSGTMALEIALRALKIGPGDEVITTPFTWISTAETIALVGAKPVFVDIQPHNFNIDPSQIEAALTPRTKALIPVNLFGQLPDYGQLNAIGRKHGIAVIEDAAQSFGALQNGRCSGSMSSIGCTSFFPAKPLGCFGDGGALFTSDEALALDLRAIANHGGAQRHHHTLVGTNGRLDTLQAAILLAKLPHFNEEIELRRKWGKRYSERLDARFQPPRVDEGNTHLYAQYTIRSTERDALASHLEKKGIPTAIYYPKCLHQQPVFEPLGYQTGDFPESEKAANEVISLPFHPYLTEKDQDFIVDAVNQFIPQNV